MINAPFVFSMLFSIVRTFLHPITADKFCVCSSDYATQFAADGISLDGGATHVPDELPSWRRRVSEVRRQLPEELLRSGYIPPEDANALRARGVTSRLSQGRQDLSLIHISSPRDGLLSRMPSSA